jgi:hypothetical protein
VDPRTDDRRCNHDLLSQPAKKSILERLRQEDYAVDEVANGCLTIMGWLELCFLANGELDGVWVEIYVY